MFYKNYIKYITEGLSKTVFELNGKKINDEDFFTRLINSINPRTRIFFYGNGASMSFSMHMALDWFKNAKVESYALADAALITALVNDYSKEKMFEEHFKSFKPNENDILCVISSSGNSPNIVEVLKCARELNCLTIGFSGLNVENVVRKNSMYSLYVPLKTYGMVECIHQILLHLWLDKFMKIEEWNKESSQNMNYNNLKF